MRGRIRFINFGSTRIDANRLIELDGWRVAWIACDALTPIDAVILQRGYADW